MSRIIHIVPAIMPHSMNRLREDAITVSRYASEAQLDITDGEFVPGITWPYDKPDPMDLEELPMPSLVWEVHLMINEPGPLGEAFARIDAERIVGHIEAFGALDNPATVNNARRALSAWRDAGAREAGISIMLDTPLSVITPLIEDGSANYVQVMGIAEIGAQGHSFDERGLARIHALHTTYPELIISADGGVTLENARTLVEAGATRLAVGSALWGSEDAKTVFRELLQSVQLEVDEV